MKAEQNISSYKEAKQIDLVEYLSGLGFKPAKIRGNNYWYLSPLRDEKTPSFKIDRKINCWYDHGIGKGGNLVDFGMVYFNCSSAVSICCGLATARRGLTEGHSISVPHPCADPRRMKRTRRRVGLTCQLRGRS